MYTSLEEIDGRGLESLFFSKKDIRIIPLESITQMKIPVHVSQYESCHICKGSCTGTCKESCIGSCPGQSILYL